MGKTKLNTIEIPEELLIYILSKKIALEYDIRFLKENPTATYQDLIKPNDHVKNHYKEDAKDQVEKIKLNL